jgi:hypothetical protein
VWPDRLLSPSIIVQPPHVPAVLRLYMNVMGVTALMAFSYDLYHWFQDGARYKLMARAAAQS